jgi:hypothetical protein
VGDGVRLLAGPTPAERTRTLPPATSADAGGRVRVVLIP